MTAETVPSGQQANQNLPTETSKSTTPEYNFAQMRKLLAQEREEKERLKQEKSEWEQERQRLSKNADDDYGSEPYIDPKTLEKKFSNFESKIASIVDKKAEEKARSMIEEERRNSYLKQNADFEQVMAPEIIQKFAEKCPGMAEAILRMPDGFDRQRLVYEAIKNTGINKKEEPVKSIQEKIDAKRTSPYYSPGGVGAAPYAAAADFSATGQKNAYDKLQQLKSRLRLG